MPFDGSGNYTPAPSPNFPAIGGTTISSTYYNAVINDIVSALNNVITRDGQGKPSAAINWNGQNLTNVGSLGASSLTLTTALGVASGGTGVNGSAATDGQVLIGNGAGFTLTTLTAGSNITITNAAGAITIAGKAGTVTSVSGSGGTTGLTFTGGPITTSGTLTLGGTLAVANGGTGATTAGGARSNLGLGTLATANTVDNSVWSGTVLAVTNGGTGTNSLNTLLTNMGFGWGSNANGYWRKTPNGDGTQTLECWGTGTAQDPWSGNLTFPATFADTTSVNLSISCSLTTNTNVDGNKLNIQLIDVNTYQLGSDDGPRPCYWRAIGKAA